MNQEQRFDELTRALATGRLSRRQVLKSFAVGALLASPLGALWSRKASAQAARCVSSTCTTRAQNAYDKCKQGCRGLSTPTARRRCLQRCKDTYAGRLLNCGCVALELSSSTPKACADPCTPQALFDRASQNTDYSKIVGYLTSDPGGFAANGAPKATVLRDEGTLIGRVLEISYTNFSDSTQTATLYYSEDRVNGQRDGAVAHLFENGVLRHVLVVSTNNGLVQKEPVPEQQPTASASSTDVNNGVSSSSAASVPDADTAVSATGLLSCPFVCDKLCEYPLALVCAPVGLLCSGGSPAAIAACAAVAVEVCTEGAKELVCSDFCKSVCDCNPLKNCEGGTGFRGCCEGCEDCVNGQCKNTCLSPGPLGRPMTCCVPSSGTNTVCVETCPPGQYLHDNTCNCVCPEGTTYCGRACCGPCRTCGDDGHCRDCNACETCDDSGDCVPKITCPGGKAPDQNCACPGGECPQGLTAFSVQSGEPVLGATTARAAQATVVCCPEGEQPCGNSGECCTPDQCNESTGQCTGQGGTCDPPCGVCETCQNGTCVANVTCDPPEVLNPDTCQCEDPGGGECPPGEEPCGDSGCCPRGNCDAYTLQCRAQPLSCGEGASDPCQADNGGYYCCGACMSCPPVPDVPGSCANVDCSQSCQTCNPQTNTCEGGCASCQVCASGTCRPCNRCETCEDGECVSSLGTPCGATCCNSSQTCCNGQCVNTSIDRYNCGGCGNSCITPDCGCNPLLGCTSGDGACCNGVCKKGVYLSCRDSGTVCQGSSV